MVTNHVKRFEKKRNPIFIVIVIIAAVLVAGAAVGVSVYDRLSASPPKITFWYGEPQIFGVNGVQQYWINLLGTVSDMNGVALLTYSLNDGVQTYASIGPDTRRLAKKGDFNIELDVDDLKYGKNKIHLITMDQLGNISNMDYFLIYEEGKSLSLPYSIRWNEITEIQSAAQVVDGYWRVDKDGVTPVETGYDRLIAIGDVNWQEYEILVPITIHKIDLEGFRYPSGGPGVGLILHWSGHTDYPQAGWQPRSGWLPMGAIAWFRWIDTNQIELQLVGNQGVLETKQVLNFDYETKYFFRIRVAISEEQGNSTYHLKAWKESEDEPAEWLLSAAGDSNSLNRGSILLLAHEASATFGDITINPID